VRERSRTIDQAAAVSYRLLLMIWGGALLYSGYVAAPLLFAQLADRQLAGALAGSLFHATALIGYLAAVLLLPLLWWWQQRWWGWRQRLVMIALLLVAVGDRLLQPQMAALKSLGLTDPAVASQFARWHGSAAILHLLVTLLILLLVATGTPARQPVAQRKA